MLAGLSITVGDMDAFQEIGGEPLDGSGFENETRARVRQDW